MTSICCIIVLILVENILLVLLVCLTVQNTDLVPIIGVDLAFLLAHRSGQSARTTLFKTNIIQ